MKIHLFHMVYVYLNYFITFIQAMGNEGHVNYTKRDDIKRGCTIIQND